MAFVFTVEDGTGLPDANSYIEVAYADDYLVVDANAAATWAALNSTAKEQVLAWASRVLDQKVQWRGSKTVPASGLRWPRTGVHDRDREPIADDVVPPQVQQATAEMAKLLLTSDPTVGQNTEYLKELKVDVIELIWQDRTSQPNLPDILNEILAGLGGINTGGVRFVRIAKT